MNASTDDPRRNATATCSPASRWGERTLWLVAAAYVLIGITMMVVASPKVPYADPWRFLAVFLEEPFPSNVLIADNGHREVLPSLVRLADLHWCDANQWLQIVIGLVLAMEVVKLLWRSLASSDAVARAATAATIAIGIFWLGNSRKLAHGNETVSLFFVLLFVAIGLAALSGTGAKRIWIAGTCGVLASLSFGAGAASFAPFLMILWLRREPIRQYAVLLGCAGVAALAMMIGNHGSAGAHSLEIVAHVEQLLRWIGAPFVWALSPMFDAAHADRQPLAALRAVLSPMAHAIEGSLGPSLTARWPAAAFGAVAVFWLSWQTLRLRASKQATAQRTFAIGLAWFGFGVGLLVVVARCDYFQRHPDQVVSQRYLSWSMMIWTGLLLGFVLDPTRRPRSIIFATLTCACLFAPSQVWTGRYAFKRQTTARQTAIAAAVEVLDAGFPLAETTRQDLLRSVPLLKDAPTSVWTWPEVQQLGQPAPDNSTTVVSRGLNIAPANNLFKRPGCTVTFSAAASGRLLLLADATGIVRGLATRTDSQNWIGWVRGACTPNSLRILQP